MTASRRQFLAAAAAGAALPLAARRAGAGQSAGAVASRLRAAEPGGAVLAFGGDWFLTRRVSDWAGEPTSRGFDVLRGADAAFINLENGLSTGGAPELGGFKYGPALRGEPRLVDELAWAGVQAVSLANNHTGNYGREALLETIATLDGGRIAHAGAGRNVMEAFSPAYVNAADLTVAFFSLYSYYYVYGAADVASPTEAGVACCRAYDVVVGSSADVETHRRNEPPHRVELAAGPTSTTIAALREDVDRMAASIKDAAGRADVSVVSIHFHWGRHGKHDLLPHQRALAQELIDAGADLIVGHGPHAIKGVELYRNRPIVYSVGNLVNQEAAAGAPSATPPSAPHHPQTTAPGREGLVLRVIAAKRAVRAVEFLPISMGTDGYPAFAMDAIGHSTLFKLNGLSASLGTELRLTDWFASLEVA